jgi:hypothetical protein
MRTTPGMYDVRGYGADFNRGGFNGGRRGRGYGREMMGRRGARDSGGDYWWLGEHELRRRGVREEYDEAFRRFDEENHPRYSPVGGNYHAMGGSYQYRRPPGPLREETWFSDWTRWF